MAINLEKYIQETHKPQTFVVKLAAKPEKENIEYMKKMLEYKGMSKMTNFKQLPFQPTPRDFPRLKDFLGEIYQCEMTFDYPMTENLLRNEISNYLELGFAYIIVRTEESPLNELDEDYLAIEDEKYEGDLLEKKYGSVDVSDWYGEEYNEELAKAQDKHASSVKNQYEEVKVENKE
jgi:hypothetical protein